MLQNKYLSCNKARSRYNKYQLLLQLNDFEKHHKKTKKSHKLFIVISNISRLQHFSVHLRLLKRYSTEKQLYQDLI